MTWHPTSRRSKRLFRVLTVAVTAASLPTLASAQVGFKAPKTEDRNAPSDISAEQMTGRPDREVELERDVEIIRGSMVINSDWAKYRIVEDEIEASGNLRMRRDGESYTGDELKIKMDVGRGYILNPTYRMEPTNAQGEAERMDFESEDRARITDGTYSTCEGPDPDWYLKSSTMTLDRGRDIGYATNSVVFFKGVPIMGTPAMSFPLSGARKSGFLPPTIGTSSKGGFDVTVPYYFNIAPNRDLTLLPRMITKRGLQLGAEARYLGETYSGKTLVEGLMDDRQTRTNRYALSSTHLQTFSSGLALAWNINAASDDEYPDDFSRSITETSQRLLLRDISLAYSGQYWNVGARMAGYQVLQDPLAPIARPYDRQPQLTFHAGRMDVAGGFDWSTDADMTWFWHPDLVRGSRFVVNPRVSYPIIRPGFFMTPSLSMHASTYDLTAPDTTTIIDRKLSRVLPTFSLDSGLVFERETNFFGQAATQTLEPRVFYVRTPYRDQAQFPVFDSALADLSFAQIFSENRFVGNDRISDANQLTVALVSRYLEPNGAERLRMAIAQRFYFEDQRVAIGTPTNDNRSDVLLSASAQLSKSLSTEGNLQYGSSSESITRANYGVRWQPAPKKVLNLTYRRDLPNNLRQVDVSGQWPIAQRYYAVGRINYSLPDNKVAEGLLGVEYKDDCWIFRVVAQKTPTSTGKANTSLFFQLELSGLTRLGSNPLQALKTSIPGYQLITDSNVNPDAL